MAINLPVAGQSVFNLITLDDKGNVRIIGTEHVDERLNYLDTEASNYSETPPDMIAMTNQVISYWAAVKGFEGGDADKVLTEINAKQDIITAKLEPIAIEK